MTVAYLADTGDFSFAAGRVLGALIIPGIGLVLLIVGLQRRSASRRRAPMGYPPGYPGYPGYPGQQGFPGYAPYPTGGYPPVPAGGYPPPKPGGTGFLVTGIALLVLGLMGVAGSLALGIAKQSRLEVGDCFTNEALDKSRPKPTRCTDPNAVLEYAADTDASGNCPDGKLKDSSYLSVERDGTRRCFAPNLLDGHCYKSFRNDESIQHVTCGAGGKVIRVVTRVDGLSDTSACTSKTHAVTFPVPKRTYCTETDGTI